MNSDQKLFVVYLGGTAPRANTELHDVVFVVGPTIESTYEQLLELWFGSPDGLHLDSWAELSIVDGHRVRLSEEPLTSDYRLFFVNMGAYVPGELVEAHANMFFVVREKKDAVRRAKARVWSGTHFIHRDYLHDVDECLQLTQVGPFHIHLEPTTEPDDFRPVSAYHLVPRGLVAAFKQRGA